ncbi:MAG: exodeoxyribonuclease III [Alphaproteobacteria bacterium]
MRLKLATWNVNSVRLRLKGLARLAAEASPDVICLQETKVTDEAFPLHACRELGYPHILIRGQKSYNGVAILSRLALEEGEARRWCGRADSRHLIARLDPGIELHNFYVPSGGDVPDPKLNEKFAHKLDFLAEMTACFEKRPAKRLILVGDLNVAPLETDVWSHKQLLKVVSHTPVEVEALARLARSQGWIDVVRRFIPPEEKLFSWWSYRARNWETSDRGRRLDHIWVTPALEDALSGACVLKPARGWDTPSDHVPVIATLEV